MQKLITDPRFKVSIDPNSNQANPDMACWSAMHRCVDGGNNKITTTSTPVESVIKHALKFGHWDVLHHASIKIDFDGFPHDTAMQFRTHRSAHVLVQSLRYSEEQFTACADGNIDPQELFYFPPNSNSKLDVINYGRARRSCQHYVDAINSGAKKEDARRFLIAGYRQGFTISATFANWMHIFDRRLLADTQIEAQTAAWMALDQLRGYSGFFEWYRSERAGKNMLSP